MNSTSMSIKGVLNREDPEYLAADKKTDRIEEMGEIDCAHFSQQEVMTALKGEKE